MNRHERRRLQSTKVAKAARSSAILTRKAAGSALGTQTFADAAADMKQRVNDGDARLLNDVPRMLDVFAEHGREIRAESYRLHTREGVPLVECAVFDGCARGQYLTAVRDLVAFTVRMHGEEAAGAEADTFAELFLSLDDILSLWLFPNEDESGDAQAEARARAADLFLRGAGAAGRADVVLVAT